MHSGQVRDFDTGGTQQRRLSGILTRFPFHLEVQHLKTPNLAAKLQHKHYTITIWAREFSAEIQ